MDREHHLFDCAFKLHRRHALRDQLRSLRTDDVCAQDLAVLRIRNNLHKPIMGIHNRSLRVTHKRELAHLDLVALFLRLRLRQPNGPNLRIAIRAARNALTIHRPRILSSQLRRHHHATHRAHMCQLRQSANDVADCEHARLRRLHPLIRHHKTAIRRDLDLIEATVIRTRRPPYGNQHLVYRLGLRLARRVCKQHKRTAILLLNLLQLRADKDLDPTLLVKPRQFLRDIFILHVYYPRQRLQNRYVCAKALEH